MSKTVLFGNAAAYSAKANPALLASGEIGIYSIAETGAFTLITTTCSAAQKQLPIMIAQGGVTGGNFKSVIIYPNGIVKAGATALPYVAAVPNVDIVGYAGSGSDTIQASVAGTYNLTITNTSLGTVPMPFNLASLYYQNAAQATPFQVAYDWAKAVNGKTLNASLFPYDRFVFASVLTNQSSTQLVTSAPANVTGTFVNGSTSVTLSGSTAGGTTPLSVGSFIRVGHATTTTLPVYKIASMPSATSIILDAPYVNESLTVGATVATVALGRLDAAPDVSDLAGVRLASRGNWFDGSSFTELRPNTSIATGVSGNALGTVIVHNGSASQSYLAASGAITSGVFNIGYGIGYQARKQELQWQGYQGNMNRSFLPYAVQYFSSETSLYDGYSVIYRSFPNNGANDGNAKEEMHDVQIFCINAGGSGSVATNALVTASIPTILSSYINA
jgi:hypothetical protein